MSEDYFNKVVPLRLQTSDREERRCSVRVKVCLTGVSTASHRKDLTVQLTDDEEPYFFYFVAISEDDFHSLKTQQGLRVDFSSFPHNIVHLLEQCVREGSSDDPKFLLHLVCNSATSAQLEMVETNPFKHLTHLSLKLVAGSDSALKKHLAQCVQSLKEEKALAQERFSTCQSDLNRAQQLLEERTRQLSSVRAESSSEVSQLVSAHALEVTRLKEESRQALAVTEEKVERQRLAAQEGHGETVRRLEKQAEVLSESLQRLTSEKSDALESLRQTRLELNLSQERHQTASSSLESMRTASARLEKEVHEHSVKVTFLEERVSGLEQELADKDQALKRNTQLLEKAAEQKGNTASALAGQQGLCAHLEDKVESLTAEVAKGNEIIKRMHQELRTCKAKIKNRNLLAVEQEKLIAGKETDLELHHQEVTKLSAALHSTQTELTTATSAKAGLEADVLQLRDELQKSQNVINYLNRQVTEQRLGQQQQSQPSAFDHASVVEGSSLSALNTRFVGSSWTGNSLEPSRVTADTDVRKHVGTTGRPPLHPLQSHPSTGTGFPVATEKASSYGSLAPKRSGIPVAVPSASTKPPRKSDEAGKPPARKDADKLTAAGSITVFRGGPVLPNAATGSDVGLDARYLQGTQTGPLRMSEPSKTSTALDSAYFPQ